MALRRARRFCAPAALGGQELALVAARGATVVAFVDVNVWRSPDGGTTFDVAAVLTPFVSDADGVVEIGPARGFRRRLEGRVDALVACGPGIAARWPTTAFTGSISREAISSSAHARRCAP